MNGSEILPEFAKGDVMSVKGPGVPREMWDKFFIVTDIDAQGLKLSEPFTTREAADTAAKGYRN